MSKSRGPRKKKVSNKITKADEQRIEQSKFYEEDSIISSFHVDDVGYETRINEMWRRDQRLFEGLKPIAEKLLNVEDRIDFWNDESGKYKQRMTFDELFISGQSGRKIPNATELFFPFLCMVEIERLQFQLKLRKEDSKLNERSEYPKYSWKTKNEQAQLIYVLAKSNRIFKDGAPITQNELASLFKLIFGDEIKVNDLVHKSLQTYKASDDGKNFISELNDLINKYAEEITIKKRED